MIKGIYKNGHVELTAPVDWPEGCLVTVTLDCSSPIDLGLDERTWVETPENRAALTANMKAYDPPDISDEEWVEFEADLKWIGNYKREAVEREPAASTMRGKVDD
jgi:hypothetical protein